MTTIIFWAFAAIAVGSALLCVTRRSPIASALWLVVTLFALAALFVILDAQFIAVLQVLVYAGAIMVLFLFVIMLLNLGRRDPSDKKGVQRPGPGSSACLPRAPRHGARRAAAGRPGPAATAAGHGRRRGPAAVQHIPAAVRDHEHAATRRDRGRGSAREAQVVMLLGPALLVSAVLFTLGVAGVLLRRNAIVIFMCVELMLNAANLTFVALAQRLGVAGQVFVFFVMAVAAAEAAVGHHEEHEYLAGDA